MKHLLFVTGCFPEGTQQYYIDNSNNCYSLASNVLSWRIIEGICAQKDVNLTVYSCPFVPFYPFDYKLPYIKSYNWSHSGSNEKEDKVIGCINVKYWGIYDKSVRLRKQIVNWVNSSPDNRHILFYSNDISFMRLVKGLKTDYPDLKITVLITDLNEFDKDRMPPRTIKQRIKQFMFDFRIKTVYSNMEYVDNFVLLANRMRDFINIKKRSSIICEGICNANVSYNRLKDRGEVFKIVYSGNLHKRYGILNVIEAVISLGRNFELHICGDGDSKKNVEELSQKYSNIQYHGMLPNDKVLEIQQSADLLVNSMPNFGRHTELSFPSKLMEYMVQGRPVACFKVLGIPDDYDEHLIYFKNEEPESIADTIKKVSELTYEERLSIGENNRKFILENKNQTYQVQRILKLIFNE